MTKTKATGLAITLSLFVAVFLLTSCTPGRVIGDTTGIEKEVAAKQILSATPMRRIDEMQTTPPGPVMWVAYGVDENGRELVSWLSSPLKYVYLDEGISRSAAKEKVKSAGYSVAEWSPILSNPDKPYWYVSILTGETFDGGKAKATRGVWVDFKSGEIIMLPN